MKGPFIYWRKVLRIQVILPGRLTIISIVMVLQLYSSTCRYNHTPVRLYLFRISDAPDLPSIQVGNVSAGALHVIERIPIHFEPVSTNHYFRANSRPENVGSPER